MRATCRLSRWLSPRVVVSALSSDETPILRQIGAAEVERKRLVTYPLWEAWDTNRKPTGKLEAKGLLMGAESGTYFLTPTGRLAAKYLRDGATETM